MEISYDSNCCGIVELNGITGWSARGIIEYMIRNEYFNENPRAYAYFSTTEGVTSGTELAAYIARHQLGRVRRMTPKVNPNTGNMLTMWVWQINNKRLAKHGREQLGLTDEYYYTDEEGEVW